MQSAGPAGLVMSQWLRLMVYQVPVFQQHTLVKDTQSLGMGLIHTKAQTRQIWWHRQKHKPGKYDGTSDWADYLRHFEMVSTWNRWGTDYKAAQLSKNLTGIDRQAWPDTFCASPVTSDALVTALTQRFKPGGPEEADKVQIRNRFWWRDESCMDYGYALRRLLAIRAVPQIKHEAREELIVDLGAVSIIKTVLPGMAIPMLKIRRPNGRLIFNMEIAIRR